MKVAIAANVWHGLSWAKATPTASSPLQISIRLPIVEESAIQIDNNLFNFTVYPVLFLLFWESKAHVIIFLPPDTSSTFVSGPAEAKKCICCRTINLHFQPCEVVVGASIVPESSSSKLEVSPLILDAVATLAPTDQQVNVIRSEKLQFDYPSPRGEDLNVYDVSYMDTPATRARLVFQ